MDHIYTDIAMRTGGNIYIGVVGPVRTGKSTLIKRIMQTLVIPNIEDPYRRDRARDELPQSGSGKTIMTAEPKFIPEEAVEISPDGKAKLRLRMIDSVGYMVEGAVGASEDGVPRMITTPWFDHEIPMTEAAELGTKKVIQEHCSVGLLVTTDGSVTDIPRSDYIKAEDRALADMKATGKPFLVIVNSRHPASEEAQQLCHRIRQNYGAACLAADCQTLDETGIRALLQALLYAFPMRQLRVFLPRWMDALDGTHPVKAALYEALLRCAGEIGTLEQAEEAIGTLAQLDTLRDARLRNMDLATGTVDCEIHFPEELFYEILSAKAGLEIRNDAQLLQLLEQLCAAKKEYDKVADALSAVQATGYGVVMPTAEQMTLEAPEVIRKGGSFGVRLKAGAPSIHMMRIDVDTEITPMVGDEKQSQDLIRYFSEDDKDRLWESPIFGRSVYDLIRDGIQTKLLGISPDVSGKFRESLGRIVNEGATGLICLIL